MNNNICNITIISADILTNFAEISSGPFALFKFSELMIWFMPLAFAQANSNSLSGEMSFNFLDTGISTVF